ncbi:MAG: ATP-binding protein [Lachnospiraceae bacterium]|nr:ATP-binding protein [Lachnospiraceae bacterium]
MEELIIEAKDENLGVVQEFIEKNVSPYADPPEKLIVLQIAVEEIFVNISHYAYNPQTGPATIRVEILEDPVAVELTFFDNGIPYDPLAKADPDVTLDADERDIGGLGIFMVKQSMDDVSYEYKDGQNILTIKKLL